MFLNCVLFDIFFLKSSLRTWVEYEFESEIVRETGAGKNAVRLLLYLQSAIISLLSKEIAYFAFCKTALARLILCHCVLYVMMRPDQLYHMCVNLLTLDLNTFAHVLFSQPDLCGKFFASCCLMFCGITGDIDLINADCS